jgi:carbon storage regulator
MLVLSRYQNESVIIDGNIRVTVLEVRGDRIRLGIEAPPEVPVLREELLTANRRELALA